MNIVLEPDERLVLESVLARALSDVHDQVVDAALDAYRAKLEHREEVLRDILARIQAPARNN
jgi:hypothetical protein